MGQDKTKIKIQSLNEGANTSNLYKPDSKEKPKTVSLDKFGSAAEAKMQLQLEQNEKHLKEKAKKVHYEPVVHNTNKWDGFEWFEKS